MSLWIFKPILLLFPNDLEFQFYDESSNLLQLNIDAKLNLKPNKIVTVSRNDFFST